jgi:hypothetical protein
MGSAAIPFVPTYPVSVIDIITAGCTPGEHEPCGEVSFDLLLVFFNNRQIDPDGLPIFIYKAKNHVTATRIDEHHIGIHFTRLMRKLIIASFTHQTRRICVAGVTTNLQKLKRA